jgi:hypothetical protein
MINPEPVIYISDPEKELIQKESDSKIWTSCCFKMNTSATKYFIQTGILGTLIIFSATMLVVDKECESQRNYSSLLMICLGCFLPSPKMT